MTGRLLLNELIKIFSLWRSYISFGLICILMPLILWAYGKGSAQLSLDSFNRQLGDMFTMVGNLANGFTAAYFIMNFFYLHIPFLVVLVGGDSFAGEASNGTFRVYATRPVGRIRIFLSKLMAAYIYVLLLMILIALMSLGLGLLWHGGGDMLVFQEGILILSQSEAGIRFILAYLIAFLNMTLVLSIALFFSVIVRNAVGPVIGAMAVLIFSYAFSSLPLDIFEHIQVYFFTYYFDAWKYAFHDPVPWDTIAKAVGYVALHILFFAGGAACIFKRKDILS